MPRYVPPRSTGGRKGRPYDKNKNNTTRDRWKDQEEKRKADRRDQERMEQQREEQLQREREAMLRREREREDAKRRSPDWKTGWFRDDR